MPARIRSDRPANGPGGLRWEHANDVCIVEDEQVIADLLARSGFSDAGPAPAPTPPGPRSTSAAAAPPPPRAPRSKAGR